MTKSIIALATVLLISACAGKPREMPTNDSSGSDEMRLSPCVCVQLDDYNGSGFEWLG